MRRRANDSVLYVESVSRSVMHTQQSSSLTARMHHNSQKRINTSKLFWDLGDLALAQQSQKHPSASLQQLCVHNTADSAGQWTPGTRVLNLPFFNLCVYLCCTCRCSRISAASVFPLILPTSYLQRFIKDYLTIYIQRYHQWRWGLLDEFLLSV